MKILNSLTVITFLIGFENFLPTSQVFAMQPSDGIDHSSDDGDYSDGRLPKLPSIEIFHQPSGIFDQTIFEDQDSAIFVTGKPTDSYGRIVQRQLMSKGWNIPHELLSLHSSLKSILSKVDESPLPDIVDIIFLLESNGKTQCLVLTKFLAKLEESIAQKIKEKYPELRDIHLSDPVDAFVGAGSAAIPAAAAAVSQDYLSRYIPLIESMASKLVEPKIPCGCCGCLRRTLKARKDFTSAFQGTDPVVVYDYDSPDFQKFIVDDFDMKKRGGENFIRLFGGFTLSNLQSRLELISLPSVKSDSILDMVNSAIMARRLDNERRIKYLTLADAFDDAAYAIGGPTKERETEEVNKAARFLSKVSFVSINGERPRGSIKELMSILTSNTDIMKNLVLVSLSAETASIPGGTITITFSHNVHCAKNDLKIINFNYKFIIPSYMYMRDYGTTIDSFIDQMFLDDKSFDKHSTISSSVRILIDFLTVCNNKVLATMEADSEDRELLYSDFSASQDETMELSTF